MKHSFDVRAMCPYYRKFDGETLFCINEVSGRVERRCSGAENVAALVDGFCSKPEPDCPVYAANAAKWEAEHRVRIFPFRPEPCAMEERRGDTVVCRGYKIDSCPGRELCPYYVSRESAARSACRAELRKRYRS